MLQGAPQRMHGGLAMEIDGKTKKKHFLPSPYGRQFRRLLKYFLFKRLTLR